MHLGLKSPNDRPGWAPSTEGLGANSSERDDLNHLYDAVRQSSQGSLNLSSSRYWIESFSYDERGNRTRVSNPWGTVNSTFDASDRLTRAGNRTYTYDPNGNLKTETTSAESVAYEYTPTNRLAEMTRDTVIPGRSEGTVSYGYDALGRRARKSAGDNYKGYLYDGMSFEKVGVYALDPQTEDVFGSLQRDIRGPAVLAPSVVGENDNANPWRGRSRRLDNGNWLMEEQVWLNGGIYETRQGSNATYHTLDVRGSVSYRNGTSGHSGYDVRYDAFGVPIEGMKLTTDNTWRWPGEHQNGHGNDWWWPWGTRPDGWRDENPRPEISESYGYSGKSLDQNTGMYDYGFRHYSPLTARFTSLDPIKDGTNWYAFVGGDPINRVDVWGLSASDVAAAGGPVVTPIPLTTPAEPVIYSSSINPADYRPGISPLSWEKNKKSQAEIIKETLIKTANANPSTADPAHYTCVIVLNKAANELNYDMRPFAGMNANAIHDKLATMAAAGDPDVIPATAVEAQAAANNGDFVIAAREKWKDANGKQHSGHVAVVVLDSTRTVENGESGTKSPRVEGGGLTEAQLAIMESENASYQFSFGSTILRPDYYIYRKRTQGE